MRIFSADEKLIEIRTKLRQVLPGVIGEINAERSDFGINQIQPQDIFFNVEEAVNATEFILLQGILTEPKNAGANQKDTLQLDVFIGFLPESYATVEQATFASYRYQAALQETFSRMEIDFGHIRYAGAEPPGSLRVGNKALYGALVRYDIQLF